MNTYPYDKLHRVVDIETLKEIIENANRGSSMTGSKRRYTLRKTTRSRVWVSVTDPRDGVDTSAIYPCFPDRTGQTLVTLFPIKYVDTSTASAVNVAVDAFKAIHRNS